MAPGNPPGPLLIRWDEAIKNPRRSRISRVEESGPLPKSIAL